METINKKDFIEIKFTGYVNGEPFDSNIPEELKKINPEAEAKKTIIAVGERMIVKGFDDFLPGKEIGKSYEVKVSPEEGFGKRNRELVKTIPLKVFTEQRINPVPGALLSLDGMIVKIITVSGARVITDFNHPLAGKELDYKFEIMRKVTDDKEKSEAFFEFFLRTIPEFEVKERVTVKGPANMKNFIELFAERFKELLGKELVFEEAKPSEAKKELPEKAQ